MNIVPFLPNVGERLSLFGVSWRVTVVEPESDWTWRIEAVNAKNETLTITAPTDERTV